MLNPQQAAAVKYIDGPLLVLAGAGSGKTRVITEKIAYLLQDCAYAAAQIVAVTFTNKAANEMKERIAKRIPVTQRRGLKIATFHRLGLSILKREITLAGLRPGFSILDAEDAQKLISQYLPQAIAKDRDSLFAVQQQISQWKNDFISPEAVRFQGGDPSVFEAAMLAYAPYQAALTAYNAVDFDDLIAVPARLLSEHVTVRERWQNKIRYLLVDEYQDSNTSQYQLVQLLVGFRRQFTVVGDDDQSIYAWRGAKPENLARLQQDYPDLKLIKLEQNYRSCGRILHAANQLIANNPHLFEKKLWSALGEGELISVIQCRDEQDEAEQVIADLICHKLRSGSQYGDYAILYRGNHQSRIFEKALRQQGISYHISGGQSWFSRVEIKDILAYFKLLSNPADDPAFLRIINTPKRGIGESSLAHLAQYAASRGLSLFQAADHIALQDLLPEKSRQALIEFKEKLCLTQKRAEQEAIPFVLREFIEGIRYEPYLYEEAPTPTQAQKKMEQVWELVDWIERLLQKTPEASLAELINKLILLDILDQADEHQADSLQMMTLHASKGLEFPYVYLVGLEEELLPHRVSLETEQVEEERRLAYVGLTRAQKRLCLSLARQRRRAGQWQDCLPSRFLEELPETHLQWQGNRQESSPERAAAIAADHLAGLKMLLGPKN